MKGGATSVDCKTKESFIFTERRSDQNKTGERRKGLKPSLLYLHVLYGKRGKS